jgi:crotonobetainyl-CoA:carnitine CoA-transferase CaiB-like acyl-CoA transferase
MERLGPGPEVLLGRNPRLIYGRVTGWGQQGPLANTAGRLRRNAEGARSVRSFTTIPFRYACVRLRQKRDWDKN